MLREGKPLDVNMKLLEDFNHVIDIKIGDDNVPFTLVPDTSMNELHVLHADCKGCYNTKNHYFLESGEPLVDQETSSTINYVFMVHSYERVIRGQHYSEKACVVDTEGYERCVDDMLIYAATTASEWVYYSQDGFLGLNVGKGFTEDDKRSKNVLDAFKDAGVIEDKMFGVHTFLQNRTDSESQIRFGAINQDLLTAGHDLIYYKTLDKDTWEIPVQKVSFASDDLLNATTKAIINPGYPFIGMPSEDFEKFKGDIETLYPDDYFTCTHWDWCFFYKKCNDIVDEMSPLIFTIGEGDNQRTYEIPASQFMIEVWDDMTDSMTCHLGVVGQVYLEDMSHWMLGETFMQGFYVSYDARDMENLYVGLSHELGPKTPSKAQEVFIYIMATLAVLMLTVVIGSIACYCCARYRKRKIQGKLDLFEASKKLYKDNIETLDSDGDEDKEDGLLNSSQRKGTLDEDNEDKSDGDKEVSPDTQF